MCHSTAIKYSNGRVLTMYDYLITYVSLKELYFCKKYQILKLERFITCGPQVVCIHLLSSWWIKVCDSNFGYWQAATGLPTSGRTKEVRINLNTQDTGIRKGWRKYEKKYRQLFEEKWTGRIISFTLSSDFVLKGRCYPFIMESHTVNIVYVYGADLKKIIIVYH